MIRLGRNKIVGMFVGMMLLVVSVDLLHLYYVGSWVEQNTFIRITELASLYIFCLLGLMYMVGCSMSLFKPSQ